MLKYEKIIKQLCNKYNIKVVKKYKSAVGRCEPQNNIIYIPLNLTNEENFIVSLHEIAHIVYRNKRVLDYELEYFCDKYALKIAEEYISYKTWYKYTQRSKQYIIQHICNDMEKGRITIDKISPKVVKYVKDHKLWYQVYDIANKGHNVKLI